MCSLFSSHQPRALPQLAPTCLDSSYISPTRSPFLDSAVAAARSVPPTALPSSTIFGDLSKSISHFCAFLVLFYSILFFVFFFFSFYPRCCLRLPAKPDQPANPSTPTLTTRLDQSQHKGRATHTDTPEAERFPVSQLTRKNITILTRLTSTRPVDSPTPPMPTLHPDYSHSRAASLTIVPPAGLPHDALNPMAAAPPRFDGPRSPPSMLRPRTIISVLSTASTAPAFPLPAVCLLSCCLLAVSAFRLRHRSRETASSFSNPAPFMCLFSCLSFADPVSHHLHPPRQ